MRAISLIVNSLVLLATSIGFQTPYLSSQEPPKLGRASVENAVGRVDSIFREFDDHTPGVAVAVLNEGRVILRKCYGCNNVRNRELIDSKTVFSLASVSKQFTAFAVLLLESEGKLSLEQDVRIFIPELPDYGCKITLRQLANHTSGLRSHLQLLGMKGLNPNHSITKEMVLQIILQQKKLNFLPGEKFSYSNSGYSLLAEVVSRVSGMSFPEFVQTRLLSPLGMGDSYVVEDFRRSVSHLSTAYNFNGRTYVAVPSNDTVVGSSGLFTTIEDLPKWMHNFNRPVVGNRQIFKEMHRLGLLNDGTTTEHAMGQFIGIHQNEEVVYHAGADAGFVAFTARFPKRNISVMLLGNCSTINAQEKALELADCFVGSPKNPDSGDSVPMIEPVELSESQLAKFAGQYLDSENHIARGVSIGDGNLIYSRPEQGGRDSILTPLNEREFQLKGALGLKIVFSESDSARVLSVVENGKQVEQYLEYSFNQPAPAELAQYAGSYFSKELETKYVVEVDRGQLYVTVPMIGPVKLDAIQNDGFCSQGYPFNYLKFARHSTGAIHGFRVSSDRAKNIYFKKRKK